MFQHLFLEAGAEPNEVDGENHFVRIRPVLVIANISSLFLIRDVGQHDSIECHESLAHGQGTGASRHPLDPERDTPEGDVLHRV